MALGIGGERALAGPTDLELLRRHGPILRYDARERDPATAIEALTDRTLGPDGEKSDRVALRPRRRPLPDVAYGRVVRAETRTWLQYWLLYADNPQDRGILRTGRHEGDWEVVEVALDRAGRPQLMTFAQHRWAERCMWRQIHQRAGHPVVYVAHASHASYRTPGEHGRPWPDPDDEAPGDGRTAQPQIRLLSREKASGWPGRWGRSDANAVPGEASSPRGPAFQQDGPYADPERELREARACGSGAPPHPWPVQAGAALLGLMGGLGLTLAWRGRRRARAG